MILFHLLSSDWLKTKHTAIRLIVIAAPLLYALAMLAYFYNFRIAADIQSKIYEVFFQAGTIFLPILIGLLAGLLCAQEEHAGNFNSMLGQAAPRFLIYFAKLLQLALLSAAVLFGAIFILLLGMNLVLRIEHIEYGLFLQGGALALIGVLSLLPLHLFLSLGYGQGASIGAGGAGFLIAGIIGTTTIGDAIWQFVPWAWPIRLSWLPMIFMPGIQLPENIVPSTFYLQQMVKGLVPSIAVFIFFTVCSIIWFYRWEGRKSYE